MKKAKTAAEAESMPLEALPNVGPAVAADLRQLGIQAPAGLRVRTPTSYTSSFAPRPG